MSVRRAGLYLPTWAILAAAVVATPLSADTGTGQNDDPTIRVVNNHQDRVAVYVVDQDANRHYVGTVNRTKFKEFEIPAELTGGSPFQVQVFPRSNPAGLGVRTATEGIQTHPVSIDSGQAVQLWVEPALDESTAVITTG